VNTYPKFLKALADAEVEVASLDWSIVAVDGAFDPSHDFLNDVTTVGDEDTIPGVATTATATGCTFDTTAISEATRLELTGVGTDSYDAFVIYVDTGVASTSLLAAYIDRRAGNSPVAATNDGGTVKVWFTPGYFFSIGG
jgi:hypothetical protein